MLVLVLAAGCQAPPRESLSAARTAFDAGDYERAYVYSSRVMQAGLLGPRHEAAYMAGISAYRMNNLSEAQRLLDIAVKSTDRSIKGKSLAMLGLIHADRRQYAGASQKLTLAAKHLTGQDRANAYFYAAQAEQKLNRPANARTLLALAQRDNNNPALAHQINQQMGATGYTIQIGAFNDAEAARAAGEQVLIKSQRLRIGYPRVEHVQQDDGSTIHLLQIGRFSTFESAATQRLELGVNDAVIVPLTSGN